MNLAIFFDPLPEELVPAGAPATVLAGAISAFTGGTFPDWRAADLALPHTGHAGLLASDVVRFIGPALEELMG